jgi:acetoin utilization deacetylase AcuC-like enzyme
MSTAGGMEGCDGMATSSCSQSSSLSDTVVCTPAGGNKLDNNSNNAEQCGRRCTSNFQHSTELSSSSSSHLPCHLLCNTRARHTTARLANDNKDGAPVTAADAAPTNKTVAAVTRDVQRVDRAAATDPIHSVATKATLRRIVATDGTAAAGDCYYCNDGPRKNKKRSNAAATTTSISSHGYTENDRGHKVGCSSSQTINSNNRNHNIVGLVIEDGAQHYDRTNKFQRERPARITAVQAALHSSGLLQQCRVYEKKSNDNYVASSSATRIRAPSTGRTQEDDDEEEEKGAAAANEVGYSLEDSDFLRVHLPGYMKRCVLASSLCCLHDSNNYFLPILSSFLFFVVPNNPSLNVSICSPFSSIIYSHNNSLNRLSFCTCNDRLDQEALQYQSIFLREESVTEARRAAAALCHLVEQAVRTTTRAARSQQCGSDSSAVTTGPHHGFAIIRPPGHHAGPSMAGGYCLVNNVAVAAAYARDRLAANKVLIVDWDVHHGNGTQQCFLADPSVLYFSVHRHQNGTYYPCTGAPTAIGTGAGLGYTVNVGWAHKGMGDAEYMAVWQHVLLPVAREYQPSLVLVSAGFDAAVGDMGECNVTPDCFGALTRQLQRAVPHVPVVCALEGGYVRSILGKCVSAVVASLLRCGDDEVFPAVSLDEINSQAAQNIRKTIDAHRPYWKCMSTCV